jgi:hypothetical protein
MGSLEEIKDLFIKIFPHLNIGFIQKRCSTTERNFPSNLLRNPCIFTTVTDKNQSAAKDLLLHSIIPFRFSLAGSNLMNGMEYIGAIIAVPTRITNANDNML